MRVVLSAHATDDIERIGDHLAENNPARALSFIEELESKCLSLGDMPERFPLVPRYPEANMRRAIHGNYLIFYRITNRVEVLRILHGAMDYENLLFPKGG